MRERESEKEREGEREKERERERERECAWRPLAVENSTVTEWEGKRE